MKILTDTGLMVLWQRIKDLYKKISVSAKQTTTSTADGGTNVMTFTFGDGTSTTLSVKNGSKGSDGARGEKGDRGPVGETGPQGNSGIADASNKSLINDVITGGETDYLSAEIGKLGILSYDCSKGGTVTHASLQDAINAVPASFRKQGLTIIYKLNKEIKVSTMKSTVWSSNVINWFTLEDKLMELSTVIKSKSNSVLFFCQDVQKGKDIYSVDGTISDNVAYFISYFLEVDINKPIWVSGGTYDYLYCFDNNYNYIGREHFSSGRSIKSVGGKFVNTKYVIVGGKTGEEKSLRVAYNKSTAFDNPIDAYIKLNIEEKNNANLITNWNQGVSIYSVSGTVTADENFSISNLIEVNASLPYFGINLYKNRIYCYSEDMTYLGACVIEKSMVLFCKTSYNKTKYIYIDSPTKDIDKVYFGVGVNYSNNSSIVKANPIGGYIDTDSLGNVVVRNSYLLPLVSAISYSNAIYDNSLYKYKKFLTFIHFSDVHGDYKRTKNVIDFLNGVPCVDFAIHTGDSEYLYWGDGYYGYETSLGAVIPESQKPVFLLVGNHDAGYYDRAVCSQQDMFNRYFAPNLEEMGLPADYSKMYYFKDFEDKKIRLIILNEYETPRTVNPNNTDRYLKDHDCWRRYLSQEQVDWFVTTLASTPDEYHVIIAMHQPVNVPNLEAFKGNSFIDINVSHLGYGEWKTNQKAELIQEIVDAWISKTTLKKDYDAFSNVTWATISTMPTVSVNADFSSRKKSNFVCYICGHTHMDMIAKVANTKNTQIIVNVTCEGLQGPGYYDSLPRVENTSAEDAFNVMSVDTDNRKIKIVRIGNIMPVTLIERKITSIDY